MGDYPSGQRQGSFDPRFDPFAVDAQTRPIERSPQSRPEEERPVSPHSLSDPTAPAATPMRGLTDADVTALRKAMTRAIRDGGISAIFWGGLMLFALYIASGYIFPAIGLALAQ